MYGAFFNKCNFRSRSNLCLCETLICMNIFVKWKNTFAFTASQMTIKFGVFKITLKVQKFLLPWLSQTLKMQISPNFCILFYIIIHLFWQYLLHTCIGLHTNIERSTGLKIFYKVCVLYFCFLSLPKI